MIQLKISTIGISVNKLYFNRGKYRVMISEARELREDTIMELEQQFTPLIRNEVLELRDRKLHVRLALFSATWFNKNNTIKKKDCSSYEKWLVDTVFEALRSIEGGIDDSQIFKIEIEKIATEGKDMAQVYISQV